MDKCYLQFTIFHEFDREVLDKDVTHGVCFYELVYEHNVADAISRIEASYNPEYIYKIPDLDNCLSMLKQVSTKACRQTGLSADKFIIKRVFESIIVVEALV